MKQIKSISTGYIDPQNIQHIAVYFREDKEEVGETIALFDRDTKKVIFLNYDYFIDKKILKTIEKLKKEIDLENFEKRSLVSEELINSVIIEIEKDFNVGDLTALAELLRFVPVENLKSYLPE